MKKRSLLLPLFCLTILLSLSSGASSVTAAGISVKLNGQTLLLNPVPLLKDGRTLVPLRQIFEALQATVTWQDGTGVVTASRDNKYVRFTVGKRFACLDDQCNRGALMDVPSQLIKNKTFVPLRFVSTALGADVTWDGPSQTVSLTDPATGVSDVGTVMLVDPPAVINGSVALKAYVANMNSPGGQLKFYLLDKKTVTGPLIAYGTDAAATYTYKPDPALNGARYLVAVAYDTANKPIYSELFSTSVAVNNPSVTITGVTANQTITDTVKLKTNQDFVAAYTEFSLIDSSTGSGTTLGNSDPEGAFTWWPQVDQAGPRQISATVYDRAGNSYKAAPISVKVNRPPVFFQEGLTAGKEINDSLTVNVTSNFPINRMELRSGEVLLASGGKSYPVTVAQSSAKQVDSLIWKPSLSMNNGFTVKLLVWDENGLSYETDSFPVTINIAPKISLNVGPKQVINAAITLKVSSNIDTQSWKLSVTNTTTGKVTVLEEGTSLPGSYTWTPPKNIRTTYELEAVAQDTNGVTLSTGKIPVQVITLPLFGPTKLVAKDKLRSLIDPLAIAELKQTNMSASLQAAQAILESGWAQYILTDKYTGQISYNLFGIKGSGPAGSVTSGTSEVYGGVYYKIDAAFRAYHDISESWQDHADLLLTRTWYAPFRAVMHDAVQGAWGLQRSGYATSPTYAINLIKLQQNQNLWVLDWVMP